MKAVEFKDLNFSFNEPVLENINLSIEKGKFYSILGPNGSGKSTLIKLLSKALNIGVNKIFIGEEDIHNLTSRNLSKNIAVVPQNTIIDFDFSALDIVLMGRTPYISRFSYESEKDFEAAEQAMKATDTWHLRHKNIDELSGGERQRVIIARAIVQETSIILLDEPISHLDIQHQIKILKEIKELNTKKGITIVAVLHDLNIASEFSDEMILMCKGKIYEQEVPEKILTNEIISKVYGIEVNVIKNPNNGKPHAIPII